MRDCRLYTFSRTRIVTLLAMLCAILTLPGCSGTIHPPVHPGNPVSIYIADYGRHSSLILPLRSGGFIEWGYGDWAWFAEGRNKQTDAVRALFFSSQATLARRVVPPQENDESLRQTIRSTHLLPMVVSEDRVNALMNQLDARYARHGDTQIFSTLSSMTHVKDDEHYWLLNNCNHLSARWLRMLGARVDGLNVQSRFTIAPVK